MLTYGDQKLNLKKFEQIQLDNIDSSQIKELKFLLLKAEIYSLIKKHPILINKYMNNIDKHLSDFRTQTYNYQLYVQADNLLTEMKSLIDNYCLQVDLDKTEDAYNTYNINIIALNQDKVLTNYNFTYIFNCQINEEVITEFLIHREQKLLSHDIVFTNKININFN